MTAGRFKNGRYQQGIGVPDTLGFQPKRWSEPQPPALKQMTFTPANSGSSRNYGATPDYVDTLNSRWSAPKPGQWLKGMMAQNKNMQTNAFDAQSASNLGISTGELRARRRAGAELSGFEADADIFSRTSAAGWTP